MRTPRWEVTALSKPRNIWWGYAKNMIRAYPRLKECYTQGVRLDRGDLREYQAVDKAIEETAALPSGAERLKVVELVLIKGTHNLAGAAMVVHCSEKTAKNYHADFIRLVGKYRGL